MDKAENDLMTQCPNEMTKNRCNQNYIGIIKTNKIIGEIKKVIGVIKN